VFRRLLGSGEQWGLSLSYTEQAAPNGLPEAFLLGRDFVGDDSVCLVLGDNIFYGHGFGDLLHREVSRLDGCALFAYPVRDPQRYGVPVFDASGTLVGIEEKPAKPASNLAVTGLYLYDNAVLDYATELQPSARGELEIADLNNRYIEQRRARLVDLGRGMAWLDTGTHDSLLEAGQFVQVLEHRQGVRIACLEELALRNGWIDREQVRKLGESMGKSSYAEYVRALAAE
jgi:glucose-1-phosphate thymidylyltransferase